MVDVNSKPAHVMQMSQHHSWPKLQPMSTDSEVSRNAQCSLLGTAISSLPSLPQAPPQARQKITVAAHFPMPALVWESQATVLLQNCSWCQIAMSPLSLDVLQLMALFLTDNLSVFTHQVSQGGAVKIQEAKLSQSHQKWYRREQYAS